MGLARKSFLDDAGCERVRADTLRLVLETGRDVHSPVAFQGLKTMAGKPMLSGFCQRPDQ